MAIVPVTEATYDDFIAQADKPVIIALGAPWCVDCQRAQPFYNALSEQYADKMIFAYADSDANPGLKEKFGVKHIPTMAVVKNGTILPGRLVEVKTPSELKAFIEEGLAA